MTSRASCIVAAVALLAVVAAACGGGGTSRGKAPDLRKIPTATLPAKLPEPTVLGEAAVSGSAATYTVREGDSLSAIADRLGVTVEALRDANPELESTGLLAGQRIRVPRGEPPAAQAPPTDTPAPEPSPTAPAEPTLAPASPAPVETPTSPAETPAPAATDTPTSLGQTYTVQAGDIPVTIAEKFGITVEELLAANPGVDPRNLQIGQVLIIPKSSP